MLTVIGLRVCSALVNISLGKAITEVCKQKRLAIAILFIVMNPYSCTNVLAVTGEKCQGIVLIHMTTHVSLQEKEKENAA